MVTVVSPYVVPPPGWPRDRPVVGRAQSTVPGTDRALFTGLGLRVGGRGWKIGVLDVLSPASVAPAEGFVDGCV